MLGSLYALYCMYVLCLHSVCMCSVCTLYTLCVLRVLCMYAFCVHSVCMHALCVPSVCCITKLYCQLLDLLGGVGDCLCHCIREKKGVYACMYACVCVFTYANVLFLCGAITPLNSSAVSPICNLWSILILWDSQDVQLCLKLSQSLH